MTWRCGGNHRILSFTPRYLHLQCSFVYARLHRRQQISIMVCSLSCDHQRDIVQILNDARNKATRCAFRADISWAGAELIARRGLSFPLVHPLRKNTACKVSSKFLLPKHKTCACQKARLFVCETQKPRRAAFSSLTDTSEHL